MLNGRCEHCLIVYPQEDLWGYNVRLGAIIEALCYSCKSTLNPTGNMSFEGAVKKVRSMRESERRRKKTAGQSYVQTRLV